MSSDYEGSKGMMNLIMENAVPWSNTKCVCSFERECKCDENTETLEQMIKEYGDKRVEESKR